MRAGAQVVTATTTVAATPDRVFAILADPREHPRIDGSGSVRGTVVGPDRLSAGATFGMQMRLFGASYRITNRVVEFEEGRRLAWRHFAGHRWRYELEPAGEGSTRVTESFDYSRYRRGAALLLRLLGFPERNRRGIEATLVRLKRRVEEARG